jgi:hypothetical protein
LLPESSTVRMFTGTAGTIRWEAAITTSQEVALTELGPRDAETKREFRDLQAFASFESETARQLGERGFIEYPFPERRDGGDRRIKPRRPDRRRAVRARTKASD